MQPVRFVFTVLLVACNADEPRFVPVEPLPNATASRTDSRPRAPVANAEAAIAAMRPGFRSCYNRGLAADPTMVGRLVIAIKIASDGSVVDVTKVRGEGLTADVEDCIIARAGQATFDAPGGLGSTIQIPLTFVPK